jgi:hypothetical protein
MAEPNLETGLRSLRNSLEKMKTLLAWQELKQSELTPDHTPGFTLLQDSVGTDLRNEYSFFLFTAMQIHTVLNDNTVDLSNIQRQQIKQQLAKIESQLYSLNLQKRLLMCHR